METEIEVLTVRPSLLLLNDYCLLEIFEFLDMDDSINLAKTSNRFRFVADRIFKIRSKFVRVDDKMINKGEEYIDHLFQHIGRHVTSLYFDSRHAKHRNLSKILGNISNKCKNLKKLACSEFYCYTMYDGGVHVQPEYSFDNVELLSLHSYEDEFTEHFTKSFFESFHRLKYVNIIYTYIGSEELKTIFQNNRSIESFFYYSNNHEFTCQLLELIPNVERLSLEHDNFRERKILEANSLLKLNRLTKLRLSCEGLVDVLRELATKGLIEELELLSIKLDKNVIDALESFGKLELLSLQSRTWKAEIKSSISWPAQLKKLRLSGFQLTKNNLIAAIQQLKRIEKVDIWGCSITKGSFNDVAKLSQEICNIVDHSNRKQRLDVVLPKSVKPADPSKKYLVESERLRILNHWNYPNMPPGINIHFPRFEFINEFGE